MLVTEIEDIIKKMSNCTDWSVSVLRYKHTKSKGSLYSCKTITFRDHNEIIDHINLVQKEYCDKRLKRYESIQEYDGTCNSAIVYYMEQDNDLIVDKLDLLNKCLAHPEVGYTNSEEIENSNENAFVIQGTITDEDSDILVKLISLKRPFTTLQHRFYFENGEFKKISKAVLNLSVLFDILIVGQDNLFFLNLAGEKLFNLERAYKNICKKKVDDIVNSVNAP